MNPLAKLGLGVLLTGILVGVIGAIVGILPTTPQTNILADSGYQGCRVSILECPMRVWPLGRAMISDAGQLLRDDSGYALMQLPIAVCQGPGDAGLPVWDVNGTVEPVNTKPGGLELVDPRQCVQKDCAENSALCNKFGQRNDFQVVDFKCAKKVGNDALCLKVGGLSAVSGAVMQPGKWVGTCQRVSCTVVYGDPNNPPP